MPKITEADYQPLKTFFAAWWECFPYPNEFPAEHHPLAILGFMEKKSQPAELTAMLAMLILPT